MAKIKTLNAGETFELKGKTWKFDAYTLYGYSNNNHNVIYPAIVAYRWIKTTQKWSGTALIVGRANQVMVGE